jgi:hypothetical protein
VRDYIKVAKNSKIMKMHVIWQVSLFFLLLALNGCQARPSLQFQTSIPNSTIKPEPTATVKRTIDNPVSTSTPTEGSILSPIGSLSVKQTPSPTITSHSSITNAPGPDFDIYYLSAGAIYRYHLHLWSAEKLVLSKSEIFDASLSPDKKLIAYSDKLGLNISESPFTMLITTIPTVGEAGSLVFSKDNHLAYSDQEGLKIYNFRTGTITLLKSHYHDLSELTHNVDYYPVSWSPDSQWLWIREIRYEPRLQILSNIMTGVDQKYDVCYDGINWRSDSRAFVSSVVYSGYSLCGEDGGVNVVEVSRNHLHEEQVYSEKEADPWNLESRSATWDPSGKNIIFIQVAMDANPEYRLLLFDYETKQVKEVDNSQDEIVSPIWLEDGEKIFYVIRSQSKSQIIRNNLITSEKEVIESLPSKIVITDVIAGGGWLITETPDYYKDPNDFIIVETSNNGQSTSVTISFPDSEKKYLGNAPSN